MSKVVSLTAICRLLLTITVIIDSQYRRLRAAVAMTPISTSTGPRGECYDRVRESLSGEFQTIQEREDPAIERYENRRDDIIDAIKTGIDMTSLLRKVPTPLKIIIETVDALSDDVVTAHYDSKIAEVIRTNDATRMQANRRAKNGAAICKGLPTTYPSENEEADNGNHQAGNFESDPTSMFNTNFNWGDFGGGVIWGGIGGGGCSGRLQKRC